jgi:hypothetical protein
VNNFEGWYDEKYGKLLTSEQLEKDRVGFGKVLMSVVGL